MTGERYDEAYFDKLEKDWSANDLPADFSEAPEDGAAERLSDCLATFRRWLHMPDPGALLIALATIAANRGDGDPVWLMLIGPPGGGKTEILTSMARLPDVYPAATLTEAALLSGTAKKDRAASAKGGLLRVIGESGIILCKDFTSVLSMNRDARAAVIAALREIYDGSWTRHVGTDGGQTLSWEGKVGLVAGCTPIIDSHHAVIGSMGERFAFYRLTRIDPEAQVRRAFRHVGSERAMRTELGQAITAVLAGVDAPRLASPPNDAVADRLISLSSLAVLCRSAVERDGWTHEVLYVPEPEAPARLALVLLRIYNALLAIGAGTATAWSLVSKAALDSMPAIRRTLAEDLLEHGESSTSDISGRTGLPTTSARRGLEDLAGHGVVVKRPAEIANRPDRWDLSAMAREHWPIGASETSEPLERAAA